MNTTELKGNWNEQKAKLKQKFAVLTDKDLMYEESRKENRTTDRVSPELKSIIK